MNAYIFAADIYCEDCGKAIRRKINTTQKEVLGEKAYKQWREEMKDGGNYDSDEYPKGPYPDGGGEADSPQHCGNHHKCINACDYGDGLPSGFMSGIHLENPLTSDGYEYVKEVHKSNPSGVTKHWMEFYEIEEDETE